MVWSENLLRNTSFIVSLNHEISSSLTPAKLKNPYCSDIPEGLKDKLAYHISECSDVPNSLLFIFLKSTWTSPILLAS